MDPHSRKCSSILTCTRRRPSSRTRRKYYSWTWRRSSTCTRRISSSCARRRYYSCTRIIFSSCTRRLSSSCTRRRFSSCTRIICSSCTKKQHFLLYKKTIFFLYKKSTLDCWPDQCKTMIQVFCKSATQASYNELWLCDDMANHNPT